MNRAIFQALAAALGLSSTGSEAAAVLLRAYGDAQPPRADSAESLCFYWLTPEAAGAQETEYETAAGRWTVSRLIPYRLNLIFYGSEAESWAFRVRDHLFVDGRNAPRGILRQAGIYPVPPVIPPALSWEEDGTHWRRRVDLSIPLRRLDIADAASGALPFDSVQLLPAVVRETPSC